MSDPISNPPFEIIKVIRQNDLEETGDDYITWYCTVEVQGVRMMIFIPFDNLTDYCAEKFPAEGAYFRQVRRQIPGFGPKHSKMFAFFDDEGFEFTPLLEAFIRDEVDLNEERLRAMQKAERKPEEQEKARKKVDNLKAAMYGMRDESIRWEAYADSLMDFANKEVIRIYPEILASEPEHILKLHDILERRVRWLADDISELYSKTRK